MHVWSKRNHHCYHSRPLDGRTRNVSYPPPAANKERGSVLNSQSTPPAHFQCLTPYDIVLMLCFKEAHSTLVQPSRALQLLDGQVDEPEHFLSSECDPPHVVAFVICDGDKEYSAGSTSNAEPLQTWDTTDPFGSGLSEVDVMEEEDLGSPDHEDATELICGLIRELSSLNRKVMATHRDLENLRCSSKTSRSSTR
ncbi:hypothetical protein NQZ68_005134 [Dissostichus eleginoides]|nr:hypothetical protein NQZ68_005134 [Dissostichus eleginoides]